MKFPPIYKDDSADLKLLKKMTIAVIGYGNQARAHVLNLMDSNMQAVVGLRENSPNKGKAESDGCRVCSIEDAIKISDIIALLIPDQEMSAAFTSYIAQYLRKGQYLLFAHGYNIHYGTVNPPEYVNVILAAPSGAGTELRKKYKEGSGIPGVFAVNQDPSGNSKEVLLAYSKAIGLTRIGMVETTFKEETETDLFGEQALLTGGIPKLIQSSYKVLLERKYNPAVAWLVCYYELKTIVDVFHKKGFEYLGKVISDTAEYGGITRGNLLVNESAEKELKAILSEIETGKFHKEWMQETQDGLPHLKSLRDKEALDPLEEIGKYMLEELFGEK